MRVLGTTESERYNRATTTWPRGSGHTVVALFERGHVAKKKREHVSHMWKATSSVQYNQVVFRSLEHFLRPERDPRGADVAHW